ncbi:ExeA family protein [Polaromonas jejuensis]|uniref:AAA family ATPase n=1 Tax=Polaromonas jejuensis TaxID=457502 RepID=A0ABW0QDK3_9BURK|nr:ExeA family protein [Polaromonas jejuensis]
MYHQYFGFNRSPFSIAPDPHNLYLSLQHREALAHLLFGATAGGGFVLLTGEIGTGKTTLCRCLLGQLPENCDVAFIFNPKLTALELLSTICDELHIEVPAGVASTKTLVDRINVHLLNAHATGRNTLLIIDEAQNLSADVLEQMRLLTNLETTERKLLQIILLGQPELRKKLAQPELAQLAQRIIARFHLGPLARSDLAGYISHRMATAGSQRQIIPSRLVPAIYRASRGVPRLVNLICDRALLGAYVEGKDKVDRKVLHKAIREVRGEDDSRSPRAAPRWAFTAAGLACVGLMAGFALMPMRFLDYVNRFVPASFRLNVVRPAEARMPVVAAKTPSASAAGAVGETTPTVAAPFAGAADANEIAPIVTPPLAVSAVGKPIAIATNVVAGAGSQPGTDGARNAALGATVSDPVGAEPVRSETVAWRALFGRWGISYRAESPLAPCEQAITAGLRCLSANGTLQDLQELNQPALLRLKPAKANRYAMLSGLSSTTATWVSEDGVATRGIGEVVDGWTGDYTVLWRVPPDYSGVMERGDRGASVLWLRRQLVQLGRLPPATQSKQVFDNNLMQQVQRFQKELGMRADGRVGPHTAIRLAAAADSQIPQLASSKKGN